MATAALPPSDVRQRMWADSRRGGTMLGDRRRERREERRGGDGRTHFRMRQKLVSIGDDYWIEDDQGDRVFKVDGKALRARKTLIFEDAHGNELLKIQERMLRIRDTMEIEDADGHSRSEERRVGKECRCGWWA